MHWRTDRYFEGHSFLTADAAAYLAEAGAALVGIDSLNIDDTADMARPVHTALLAGRDTDRGTPHRPVETAGRGLPVLRGTRQSEGHGHISDPGVRASVIDSHHLFISSAIPE